MNENYIFFPFFFSENNKPNDTNHLLKLLLGVFWKANTRSSRLCHPQPLSPSAPFSDAHVAPERTAPKLRSADTENREAETLQRLVQAAVLNQCVHIMSRCITEETTLASGS